MIQLRAALRDWARASDAIETKRQGCAARLTGRHEQTAKASWRRDLIVYGADHLRDMAAMPGAASLPSTNIISELSLAVAEDTGSGVCA